MSIEFQLPSHSPVMAAHNVLLQPSTASTYLHYPISQVNHHPYGSSVLGSASPGAQALNPHRRCSSSNKPLKKLRAEPGRAGEGGTERTWCLCRWLDRSVKNNTTDTAQVAKGINAKR